MDSFTVVDKTFPVDLDESSNLLSEVTYGPSSMMENINTGRMSPVRGRTIREIDQQLAELKKENFDLKLRIYFMQEQMNTRYKGDEVIKTNIELHMEISKYKADLQNKKQLLEKASETIDQLTFKFSEEVEKEAANIRQTCDTEVEQANQRVGDLEEQLQAYQLQQEKFDGEMETKLLEIQGMAENLGQMEREKAELCNTVQSQKLDIDELNRALETQMEEMARLQTNIGRKDRDVSRLSMIVHEKSKIEGVTALEREHLKDEMEDARKSLERVQGKYAGLEHQVGQKDGMISKLEDLLRRKEKELKDEKDKYETRMVAYNRAKTMILDYSAKLNGYEQKCTSLEARVEELEAEISRLKSQLGDSQMARKMATDTIKEHEDHIEQLARTLGKKEGELENFEALLKKAEKSLALSEAAVESLEKQLRHEDKGSDDELDRLRKQLAQLQAQLEEKENSLQSKCAQLENLGQLLRDVLPRHTLDSAMFEEFRHLLDRVCPADTSLHITINHTAADGNGHMMDGNGHMTRGSGHMTRGSSGHMTRGSGHLTHGNGYMMDGNGHMTHGNGHMTQGNGHMTHGNSHMTHGNGHMTKDDSFVTATDGGISHQDLDSLGSPSAATCNGHSGSNGSRIPRRYSTNSTTTIPSSGKLDALQRQVTDLMAQNKHLQNTLKATEETVHCQTQKMKNYKNMLVENGLVERSRSCSVPNIAGLSSTVESNLSRHRNRSRSSVGNIPARFRSMSPCNGFGGKHLSMGNENLEDMEKLTKENSKLKQQVNSYRKVLQVFQQSRSPSPNSESDKSGPEDDGAPEPMSAESASCLVESWLDMLEKFLNELSEPGQLGLPTSALDVNRLRRGLVQVRGAVQSLSETSQAEEGRLSPDSGCSDNATSAQNTLKSPLTSPTNSFTKSPITSPTSAQSGTSLIPAQTRNSSKVVQDDTVSSALSSQKMRLSSGGAEKMRHCSEFTNEAGISMMSLGTNEGSVFKTGDPGSMRSRIQRPNIVEHDGDGYGRLSVNSSPNSENMSPKSGDDVPTLNGTNFSHLSESFLDRVGNQSILGDRDLRIPGETSQRLMPKCVNTENGGTNTRRNILSTTLSNTFLLGVGDQTLNAGNQSIRSVDLTPGTSCSSVNAGDRSIQDINNSLMKDQENKKQMIKTLSSLERIIIKSSKGTGHMTSDSNQQELIEIVRRLQQQVKDSLDDNETITQLLDGYYTGSEEVIHNQAEQIAELANKLGDKTRIISENERALREAADNLTSYKCAATQDRNEIESLRDGVCCLEAELTNAVAMKDNLTSRCQSLIQAVEQYKKKCEQLTDDNKKHMEAVYRHQNRVKVIEEEMRVKITMSEQQGSATESQLRERISQLEGDLEQLRANETKYKNLLNQTRAKVNKLTTDVEMTQEQLRKREMDLKELSIELERTRDTVEEQNKQLFDNTSMVNTLNLQLAHKQNILQEQENTLQKMSSEVSQQSRVVSQYKAELQKQADVTEDLRNKADTLRQELSQSLHNRDRMVEELQSVNHKSEKYFKNANLLYSEYGKLKEAYLKLKEKLTASNTEVIYLKQQLEIVLQSERDDSQDEVIKHLRQLTETLPTFIEQNQEIKTNIKGIFNKWGNTLKAARQQLADTDKLLKDDDSTSEQDQFQGAFGNQTWPRISDLSSDIRGGADNLSSSLPLRETTPGSSSDSGSGLPCSSTGSSSKCFSVPGPIYKQGITDECLRYHVSDTPEYLFGLTQVRIDSDLRCLFAVSMIDHFEKLRKETNECKVILKGVNTRVDERLKVLTALPASESIEYSTLKEVAYSTKNMIICVDSQLSMIDCFWTSELPAPNERGEFVNKKQLELISDLKMELSLLKRKHDGGSVQEDNLCRSLESTLGVMTQARHNLQQRDQRHRLHSPHRSPSHSPRK